MSEKRTEPGKLPSHPTTWSPRTQSLHKRAKDKLGAKAERQIIGHDDLPDGGR